MTITKKYTPRQSRSILLLYSYILKLQPGWVKAQLPKNRAINPYKSEGIGDPDYLYFLEQLLKNYQADFKDDNLEKMLAAINEDEDMTEMSPVDREELEALFEESQKAKERSQKIKEGSRANVHSWIENSARRVGLNEEQAKAVADKATDKVIETFSLVDEPETQGQVKKILTNTPFGEHKDGVRQLIEQINRSPLREYRISSEAENITYALGADRPLVAYAIYNASVREAGIASEAEKRRLQNEAVSLTNALTAATATVDKTSRAEISQHFLESLAKPGASAPVKTLVSLLPPGEKERVASLLVSRTLGTLIKDKNRLVEIFGKEAVASPNFGRFIAENLAPLANFPKVLPASLSPLSRVASSILTSATGKAVLSRPDAAVKKTLQTVVLPGRYPALELTRFFTVNQAGFILVPAPAGSAPILGQEFFFRTQIIHLKTKTANIFWNLVNREKIVVSEKIKTRLIAKLAAGAGSKAATGWLSRLISGFAARGGGAALGSALGGTALGTFLGNPLAGFVVGLVAVPLITKAWGVIKNKLRLLNPFGLAVSLATSVDRLFNQSEATPFLKQPGALGTLIIVGVVALMAFPALTAGLNLGGSHYNVEVTQSAFVSTGGAFGPIRPGVEFGQIVYWTYAGDPPTATITECPTQGGTITQGPGESFSHSGRNAYDIAQYQGAPVYSTHNAYVVSCQDGLDPYEFQNQSYGNYVLLVAKTPDTGEKFYTMYAHLLTVDPIITAALGGPCDGQQHGGTGLIAAGSLIGTEDATGSTYGSAQGGTGIHLHYEYQGPETEYYLAKCVH
jgi:O6-methylguanine-DNA--protein-cysteine methyltransferase